jgi:hypothetical protein
MLEAFSRENTLHRPVALTGGLAILPLRNADLASLRSGPSEDTLEDFEDLSKQFLDQLRRSSLGGSLMYFETAYHGGTGGQGAVLFRHGELIFGPHWAEIGPINQALNLLGIRFEPPAHDEFEAVGLDRYRDAEGWLTEP